MVFFFFQAEDGIRYLVRSRGLGDVYKRQVNHHSAMNRLGYAEETAEAITWLCSDASRFVNGACLLYTSDAADERSSVDLGGRRIIKKKK